MLFSHVWTEAKAEHALAWHSRVWHGLAPMYVLMQIGGGLS